VHVSELYGSERVVTELGRKLGCFGEGNVRFHKSEPGFCWVSVTANASEREPSEEFCLFR